jgi:hypothetical protein
MPKGNRTPRRRTPLAFQIALSRGQLQPVRETGRLTFTVHWERDISHEQAVDAFARFDREIRYRLAVLDALDKEKAARDLLSIETPHPTRKQSVAYVSSVTGLSPHRVKEIKQDVLSYAHSTTPLDEEPAPLSLEIVARMTGLTIIPAPLDPKNVAVIPPQ